MAKVCSRPGCPNLAEPGKTRCHEHPAKPRWYATKPRGEAQRRYDRTRPSPRARGYTTKWDKARAAFLAKHRICVAPGCNQPATDVDHITPWKRNGAEDWKLFWDRNNWQPLCHSHHSRKTRRDSRQEKASCESGRDPIPPAEFGNSGPYPSGDEPEILATTYGIFSKNARTDTETGSFASAGEQKEHSCGA